MSGRGLSCFAVVCGGEDLSRGVWTDARTPSASGRRTRLQSFEVTYFSKFWTGMGGWVGVGGVPEGVGVAALTAWSLAQGFPIGVVMSPHR